MATCMQHREEHVRLSLGGCADAGAAEALTHSAGPCRAGATRLNRCCAAAADYAGVGACRAADGALESLPLTSHEKTSTSTLLPNLAPGDPVTIMGP